MWYNRFNKSGIVEVFIKKIFGTDEPLNKFEGLVIAVYHRFNDNEAKWIVSVDGKDYSDTEILNKLHFQEQYFMGELLR